MEMHRVAQSNTRRPRSVPRHARIAVLVALAACTDRTVTATSPLATVTTPSAVPGARDNTLPSGCTPLAVSAVSASTDDGNVPANAIDGNLATRWSGFGQGAYITADLGSVQSVCGVTVAWYQGDTRQNTFVVSTSTDGVSFQIVYSATSSGSTTSLEAYTFASTTAKYVRITVNGNTVNDWASVSELQVAGPTTPCGTLPVAAVSASTDDGNVPANAIDGNFSTRWSGLGVGAFITATLASQQSVCTVNVAWYQGDTRRNNFVISGSADGVSFQSLYSGISSGTTTGFESYAFAPTTVRYVRVTVNGNTVNDWASVAELRVAGPGSAATYNQVVLSDQPVGFWNVTPSSSTEADLTGLGNTGTFFTAPGTPGAVSTSATMPNGDIATDFNGSSQYLEIPSSASHSFSLPTTGNLSWEAWIRPDVLEFPNASMPDGFVNYMGKCANYRPTCEWEGRMYKTTTGQSGRCNRLSAYIFSDTAGLGSGADWQPNSCTLIQANQWLHVVGEYTTGVTPSPCNAAYPGTIEIWVNGVKWNRSYHGTTGCLSQYSVVPRANNSPFRIATVARDSWFKGAIGKVAIYNYRLSQAQINAHFQAMTGRQPTGSCLSECQF